MAKHKGINISPRRLPVMLEYQLVSGASADVHLLHHVVPGAFPDSAQPRFQPS